MAEHTPGPWRWNHEPIVFTAEEGEEPSIIARVDPDCDYWLETAIANARLIAAAPDLLKACEDARDAIATLPDDALGWDQDYPLKDELLCRIEAAIANAKGETE